MTECIEKAVILSKCEEMRNNADETTQMGVDTISTIDRITDLIEAMPVVDVQLISKLIQARLRGIQKIKLEALQFSDLNTAYMMKGAEEVCNEILADVGAIIGSTI